jgi:predicted ester cyclase
MTPKEVVKAFVDAHNAHDVSKMMTYLTEDSVMIDVAAPIPLNSKKDVQKLFEMIFASIDIHFEITGMIAEDNKVFAALRTTGPGTGTWAGRDVRGMHCDVFEGMFVETQGDQIKRTMFYSDTATLSRQLGGYPPAITMETGVRDIM